MEGNECGANTTANLRAASRKYRHQRYDVIIFTGGIFSPGQRVPAAIAMANWWRKRYPTDTTHVMMETWSRITRQSVINTVELLWKNYGLQLDNLDLTVVSERWHLLGIRLLFLVLYQKWTRGVASDFQITNREKWERLVRLPLYLWDPRGVGRLSRRKIKERGG